MSVIMSLRPPFKLPGRPSYYYEIDRKRRSLNTADKAEAMRLFNAIKKEYLAGRITQITGDCGISLGGFKEEFLSWSRATQPKSTHNVNKHALQKLLSAEGGTVRLDRISPKSIDKMVELCLRSKNTPTTINVYIRHLKSIFQKAVDWGHLKASPFRGVRQLANVKRTPGYIPPETIPKFLAGIGRPEVRQLIIGYLATGRRRCELLHLDWADVDMGRRRYYIRQTKTHLERWFPMAPDFVEVLQAIGPKASGKIFDIGHYHPDTISKLIKSELVKAKLGSLRLHDLRHSFAVLYLQGDGEKKGSLRTLQDLLGHAQYSTTEIYAHLTNDFLNEEISRVKLGPKLKVVK